MLSDQVQAGHLMGMAAPFSLKKGNSVQEEQREQRRRLLTHIPKPSALAKRPPLTPLIYKAIQVNVPLRTHQWRQHKQKELQKCFCSGNQKAAQSTWRFIGNKTVAKVMLSERYCEMKLHVHLCQALGKRMGRKAPLSIFFLCYLFQVSKTGFTRLQRLKIHSLLSSALHTNQ